MSEHKYPCPHCGQSIEYSDAYSGLQVPCPRCGTPIVFPGLAAPKMTSSVRLAQAVVPHKSDHSSGFSLASFLSYTGQHWKIIAMCLVPFVVLAGGLMAAKMAGQHEEPAAAVVPAPMTVDPQAFEKLTDLTKADDLVQERVTAANTAAATCRKAEQYLKQVQSKYNSGSAGFQTADAAAQRARLLVSNTRKAFDTAYAQYQNLGGKIDYRQQLQ